ncbi:MAG TPA: hypothetical protein VH680_09645 [Gemmatimonadales bacterium]
MTRVASWSVPILLSVLAVAGCGEDETGPVEDHTPADAALFVGGIDVSNSLVLPSGQVVRVEVRFLDDQGQVIENIEDSHQTALTFTPEDLATTESVEGSNFQKDVTGGPAGTGSVMVGYGHDEAADELDFGPFNVIVPGPPSPNP